MNEEFGAAITFHDDFIGSFMWEFPDAIKELLSVFTREENNKGLEAFRYAIKNYLYLLTALTHCPPEMKMMSKFGPVIDLTVNALKEELVHRIILAAPNQPPAV